jgi:UDP-N-acetylmuramyl tripeptide synthase
VDLKLFLAIFVGKIIKLIINVKGGGATAAPGLYALRIDPNLVNKLSKKVKKGSILISGTNGKTTTTRLVSDILSTKYKVIHNRQGSNLLRGIASTFISKTNFLGQVDGDIALWEVDEATLPQAIEHTSPSLIALLNLFRDQLDRYGEVDSVRKKWQRAISGLSKNTTLVLNADDPGISYLSGEFKGKTIFFGVEDNKIDLPIVENISDIKHCPNCGHVLIFSDVLSAHLGHYQCENCDFERPMPSVSASDAHFYSDFSTAIKLNVKGQLSNVKYDLPGLYNVYNVLAATAVCLASNAEKITILEKIPLFSAAFGRFQKITIKGKHVFIFLIKNPAGANEIIRTISQKENLNILAILNDNFADGKDVSWIWDTNWEVLKNKTKNTWISGIRRWDLATRFKYAEIKLSKNNVYKDINYSINQILLQLSSNDTLIILPTYTSLLSVQNVLRSLEKGLTKWQKQ